MSLLDLVCRRKDQGIHIANRLKCFPEVNNRIWGIHGVTNKGCLSYPGEAARVVYPVSDYCVIGRRMNVNNCFL